MASDINRRLIPPYGYKAEWNMTKRLRNRILIGLAILLIITGGFIIYLLHEVDKALKSDPNYNTVFTEKSEW